MTAMSYLNFDLLIQPSGAGYTARVLHSPCGQATARFTRPFSELELEVFLLRVSRPRRGVRRLEPPERDAARTLGRQLFDAVFHDEVEICLRRSMDEAVRKDTGLRIRLRLDAPDLGDIPWEFLYDADGDRFLVLSATTPLIRYLDLPERILPLKVDPPLRVLVMISSPADYPPLDVEREWAKLQDAVGPLQHRGLLHLERLQAATLTALQHQLRRGKYHIFHYVGHGAFDEKSQDGVLLLEDEAGRGRPVSGRDLGTMLYDHRSLRLALLNACEGARTSHTDPFAGVAQCLLRQGIPAVIAMQFEIPDEAAITLSNEFYAALVDGYPVDAALAEARRAIYAQGGDVEWGTPVLYLHAPDGLIFDVQPMGEEAPVDPIASSPHVEAKDAGTVPASAKQETAQADRPSQPPQARAKWWPWIAIAAAVVLLLAVATGIYMTQRSGATPADIAVLAAATTAEPSQIPVVEEGTADPVHATADWLALDTDGDGLSNRLEVERGTDPEHPDSDRDGLNDGLEISQGLDPLREDTDDDGTPDAQDREPARAPSPSESETAKQAPATAPSLTTAPTPTEPPLPPTATPALTQAPTSMATDTPTLEPPPTTATLSCPLEAQGLFASLWQAYRDRLGCPEYGTPRDIVDAEQVFEYGHMFWREDNDYEYVVYEAGPNAGTYKQFPGWNGKSYPCQNEPPEGRVRPKRGFGWVWCVRLMETENAEITIGWGLGPEQGFGPGIGGDPKVQDFDRGFIFRDSDGTSRRMAYIFFADGTFRRERY